VDALARSAAEYRQGAGPSQRNGGAALASLRSPRSTKCYPSERKLTTAEGLSNRPWFKHQLLAPGFYTAMGSRRYPLSDEAIELKEVETSREGIIVVSACCR